MDKEISERVRIAEEVVRLNQEGVLLAQIDKMEDVEGGTRYGLTSRWFWHLNQYITVTDEGSEFLPFNDWTKNTPIRKSDRFWLYESAYVNIPFEQTRVEVEDGKFVRVVITLLDGNEIRLRVGEFLDWIKRPTAA